MSEPAAASHPALAEEAEGPPSGFLCCCFFCASAMFSVARPVERRRERLREGKGVRDEKFLLRRRRRLWDKVMENYAGGKRLDGEADGGPAVPIS